jgi:GT2 family glycosyltransferase
MNNAVLMVAYNNLELTKEAVKSVLAQDIPISLVFVDNGSTDGTFDWINGDLLENHQYTGMHTLDVFRNSKNESPVKVVNLLFERIYRDGYKNILGVPNDVVLPSNMYREMLRWPRGIVTASQTDSKLFMQYEAATAVNTCTPMAVAMIRKWAWQAFIDKDGYFLDEGMEHYASDNDLALRMAACGIVGVQLDLQYWHFGSASHRLAPKKDGDRMRERANQDRAYFQRKWGFAVDSSLYGESCGNINFRGERIDR